MAQSLQIMNLGLSIGFICITAATCQLLRLISNSISTSKFNKSIFLEVIAAFELCSTCFELGVVIQDQGFLVYGFLMIFIFNYWGKAWQSATVAPHLQILELIENKIGWDTAVLRVLAQLTGASFAYPLFVKPIWSLGYQATHLERLLDTNCFTHLQVPVLHGIATEAVATFVFMTAIKILGPKKYNYLSLPFVLVTIVYTAMSFTGGYFSPILASTIQFGCKGITFFDHFLVYWTGPILGGLVHQFTWNIMNSSINRVKRD